ncbi:hypothetical protein B0H63DRAFT_547023 [Podospora didyma]|uniref:Uncharacterized protein n=1 Tax=Podospora didyma TaxID=330526 RepID=A0AAE0KJ98_9PEZI|nr:hypothetical protein B0H63DRAFT_547023 [Podospora didyma]
MSRQPPPVLIDNLHVQTEEGAPRGEYIDLPPGSHEHRVVERIIHLALLLLESRNGRRSLVEVARNIIEARNDLGIPHIYNRSIRDLPNIIDFFLATMRRNFPTTYLIFGQGGKASGMKQGGTDNMDDFNPRDTGYMTLNRVIIRNMVECLLPGQPATAGHNYVKFKFQMQISVAHEIVHF